MGYENLTVTFNTSQCSGIKEFRKLRVNFLKEARHKRFSSTNYYFSFGLLIFTAQSGVRSDTAQFSIYKWGESDDTFSLNFGVGDFGRASSCASEVSASDAADPSARDVEPWSCFGDSGGEECPAFSANFACFALYFSYFRIFSCFNLSGAGAESINAENTKAAFLQDIVTVNISDLDFQITKITRDPSLVISTTSLQEKRCLFSASLTKIKDPASSTSFSASNLSPALNVWLSKMHRNMKGGRRTGHMVWISNHRWRTHQL
jgi:hypothetical protein